MHSASDLAHKLSKRIGNELSKRISEFLDDSSGPATNTGGSQMQQQYSAAPSNQQYGYSGNASQMGSSTYFVPPPYTAGSFGASGERVPRDIKIAHVEELGDVKSAETRVERDLGFQGRLGQHVLITYGDTMFRDENWSDSFIGMTCNSVAIASPNPIKVHDPLLGDSGFPRHFLEPSAEYGDGNGYSLGITNVVELEPGRGIMYFLLNYREKVQSDIRGAGVAEVSIQPDHTGRPIPHARRLNKWLWDGQKEPWYGDVCAVDFQGHIYALGHKTDSPFMYIARVPRTEPFNIDAYEYWNGTSWQRERLDGPALGEKESIMWQCGQGQVFWSEFHNRLLFVYCDCWWTDQVLIRHASKPEGPWSEPQTVYKSKRARPDGSIYCSIPHPYFDPSGKTLVITYTNMPAIVQTIKVTFE